MQPGFALRSSKPLGSGNVSRDAAAEPVVQPHASRGPAHVRLQCPLLRTARLTKRELCALKVEFFQKPADTKGGATDGVSPRKSMWGIEVDKKALLAPQVTKSDAEFAEEGIIFVEGHEGVNIGELNNLFEKVGFPRRDPEKLKLALENTHTVMWIRYAKNTRWAKLNQLLGFARAMSDGYISASIWDVAVLPAWQRSGLGRALMERLLVRLRADSINTITLYAEPNVVGMYEKLGFVQDAGGIRGMAFQRKSKIGLKVAKPPRRV